MQQRPIGGVFGSQNMVMVIVPSIAQNGQDAILQLLAEKADK